MMPWTIAELTVRFHASVSGNEHITITHLCTLEEGSEGGLSFFSNPSYAAAFYQTKASAILVPKDFKPISAIPATLLAVVDPYVAFCELVKEVAQRQMVAKIGIEFPSYVGEGVTVGEHVYRGAFSYIGNHVVIGKRVKIYPHVYIGDHVVIGDDTLLYSGVKVADYTVIGSRCVLHPGAVIGSAGFGFIATTAETHKRIPSIGRVVLADEVEVGAHTVIDAAMVGQTYIGEDTKIDNLVQVAHNVKIGKHGGIAAQVGIAGSTQIGDYCRLGGQTGIAGHLVLGNHLTALGRAGITRSFPKGAITLSGTPAFEHKKFLSSYAHFKNLAKTFQTKKKGEQ